ncbi:MAG: STAS domain-containing protein [Janthinobacterium lividum]
MSESFLPGARLTFDTAGAVLKAGLQAIAAGQLEFDLAAVTAVDSSAVAALIGWRRAALERGLTLRVLNVPESLRNLAELYEVDDMLTAPRQRSAMAEPA